MSSEETCWSIVEGAVRGDPEARETFARTYLQVVRNTLHFRWRQGPLSDRVEDAVQDVFMDCFRKEGALGRVDRERGGFRNFLHGVVRFVALRYEERGGPLRREFQPPSSFDASDVPSEDEGLSKIFDRSWAQALLARAVERHRQWAVTEGEASLRRFELLKLRFQEGLPIREIAARWELHPTFVHREYKRAREEFKRAMKREVAFHQPGAPAAVERECEKLLSLLRIEA